MGTAIQDLKNKLESATTDKQKIETLIALANPDLHNEMNIALNYVSKGLSVKNLPFESEAQLLDYKVSCYRKYFNHELGLKAVDDYEKFLAASPYNFSFQLSMIEHRMCLLIMQGAYSEIIEIGKETIHKYSLKRLKKENIVASIYQRMAVAYSRLSQLGLSLEYFENALEILKNNDEVSRIASVNYDIGVLFAENGDFNK